MSQPQRPLPDDFAARARGKTLKVLRREFGAGTYTIDRWLKIVGLSHQIKRSPRRCRLAMPSDFAELAAKLSNNALRLHYDRSATTISRWRSQCGVPDQESYIRGVGPRPLPAGFAAQARTMSQYGLERHYGAGTNTVKRWLSETGITARAATRGFTSHFPKAAVQPAGDPSVAGRAAQHLRSFYTPVYRAAILSEKEKRKLPNRGENMFIVGAKGALPAADVIALAETRGFDPRAWARI